jgi:tagatose-6-phosphate ketose/aldose isomerase
VSSLTSITELSDREKKNRGLEYTPAEIAGQVRLWPDTYGRVEKHRDDIIGFLKHIVEGKSTNCILAGAGTSEFVGRCVEGLFRKCLKLPTSVFSTTAIVTNPDTCIIDGCKTLMISFARSGNSPESIGAVRIAETLSADISHLIITCNEHGKLNRDCGDLDSGMSLLLHEGCNDRGLAMTASFSNMVIAAQGISYIHSPETYSGFCEKLQACGDEMLHTAPDTVERLSSLNFSRAVFLGSGGNLGTAIESHLKLQELTSGSVMCTYDTFPGLRHGPEAVIDENTIVVAFVSNNAYVQRYELDLLAELKHKGLGRATLVSCASGSDAITELADFVVCYDRENKHQLPDDVTPPVHVITGQLLGLFKSIQLGFKPDAPSESGVINRVVKGVKVYDPVAFQESGHFEIIAER